MAACAYKWHLVGDFRLRDTTEMSACARNVAHRDKNTSNCTPAAFAAVPVCRSTSFCLRTPKSLPRATQPQKRQHGIDWVPLPGTRHGLAPHLTHIERV
jgi:hypothetical protein